MAHQSHDCQNAIGARDANFTPARRHAAKRRCAGLAKNSAVRGCLFTFLEQRDVLSFGNGGERQLRPTESYRKVTGGFRSQYGAALFGNIRSVVATGACRGTDAYHAVRAVLRGALVVPG